MKNKKKKRSCLERQKNEQIKETQTKYKKQERHVIGEIAPNFSSATQLPSPKRARLRLAIVVSGLLWATWCYILDSAFLKSQ